MTSKERVSIDDHTAVMRAQGFVFDQAELAPERGITH
jgi:hypothetical protein